jgi:hypothetical protein
VGLMINLLLFLLKQINKEMLRDLFVEIVSIFGNGFVTLVIGIITIVIVNIIISDANDKKNFDRTIRLEKFKTGFYVKKENAEKLFYLISNLRDICKDSLFEMPIQMTRYFEKVKQFPPDKIIDLVLNDKIKNEELVVEFATETLNIQNSKEFLRWLGVVGVRYVEENEKKIKDYIDQNSLTIDEEIDTICILYRLDFKIMVADYAKEIGEKADNQEIERTIENLRNCQETFMNDLDDLLRKFEKTYSNLYEG